MRRCLTCGASIGSASWHCDQCGYEPRSLEGIASFAKSVSAKDPSDDQHVADVLAPFEETHPWFVSRARLLGWALGRFFPQSRSLLEVGCGGGFVLQRLRTRFPHMAFTGGEPSLSALRLAHERLPDAALYHLRAEALPFEAEFDVVGAFDVLEHIENDRLALDQLFRATRPGGGMILTVPQHPSLWSPFDEYSKHHRRYTRRGLEAQVRAAGWDILTTTSFVSFLLPVVALSRRLTAQSLREDPLRELRTRRFSRVVSRLALGLERWLIRCGVRFPMGSSLLLVARRPEVRT